ncbi:MAG: VWA domain-containing protein [Acidobacteriota bacterium]|nr:VWA domain-containing protein [Acidobacteriota bacterium]
MAPISPTFPIALAAALSLAAAAADDSPPDLDARETTMQERVRVDRVTLPVSVVGPGCASVRPADVLVEEDGRPVPRVNAIERTRRSTLHALVIDASGSMNEFDNIGVARGAAKEYVAGLRPGEKVLVASFENNLRLRVPLTTIRTAADVTRIQAAIDSIRADGWTSLRDTLLSLSAYLRGREERTALVVLSDGVDSASAVPEERLRRFAETVSHDADLAVFAVGLRIPVASGVWKSLKSLARSTGGRVFSLDSADGLEQTFVEIRDLLHGEITLEYESWPAGSGPRDRQNAEPLVRRVRVELPRSLRCRVVHHKDRRVIRSRPAEPEDDLADGFSWPPAVSPVPGRVTAMPEMASWPELVAGVAPESDDPPSLSATDGETISGTIHDLQIAAGPLYVNGAGYTLEQASARPVFVHRSFDVKLPDFSRLTEWIRGPEDVVFELIRLGVELDAPDDASRETNVVISGKALPWVREGVAAQMFGHFASYANWAAAKIELEKRYAVERLVASELGRLGGDDGAAGTALDQRRHDLILSLRSGLDPAEARVIASRRAVSEVELSASAGKSAPADGVSVEDRRPVPASWIGGTEGGASSAASERAGGDGAALADRLVAGISEDEARYVAELSLNAERAERLCARGCPVDVAERLRQIEELRFWLLRKQLSEVGPDEMGRYLAEWFADVSPRELAFRLERKIANRKIVFDVQGDIEDRELLAIGWDSLWRRFGGPEGVRSYTILHPAYRPDLDRVGFYRVTLPVPEKSRLVRDSQVWMRGVFPRTPWALRLVETLDERGVLDAIGHPVYVRRSMHRPIPSDRIAAELIRPLEYEVSELADDWEIQRLAAFARGAEKERAEEALRERRERVRQRRRHMKTVERRLEELFDEDVVEVRVELAPLPDSAPAPSVFVTAYVLLDGEEPGVLGEYEPMCVEAVTGGNEDVEAASLLSALEETGIAACGFLERLRGESLPDGG